MNQGLNINGGELLLMESEKSTENILKGFWKWIELMDKGDFKKAVESIYWDKGEPIDPETFRERITTFFQIDGQPLMVVYPCQELKEMVENATEVVWDDFHKPTEDHVGWCMLKIPVTNDKAEAKKSTDAGLWAVAASFFIRIINGKYSLEFEIFQL